VNRFEMVDFPGRLPAALATAAGTLWKQAERHGYIETICGRRHYFDLPDRGHMLLNRLVSGSAADLFKLAAIELHRLQVPVLTYVHDEVLAEVPAADAENTAHQLERALPIKLGPIRGLKAEAAIHKPWSDFKQPGWAP
jgi:DNA polymerase I-like protein with 3'-5' exonuclease and polymerase domains